MLSYDDSNLTVPWKSLMIQLRTMQCEVVRAVARVTSSKLKHLVITDSIQATEAVKAARNIRVIGIASLIGEAIGRTSREESVSSLFE